MLFQYTRISALHVIALAALVLAGCGSPRTTVVENASLERAIACYIDGDLERAEALFTRFIEETHPDEDCRTAYLYLGRIYLARGDYEKAADAFSTGKALGGDSRFDEYFDVAQRHLVTSPQRIIQLPALTRGQLAALIDQMLGPELRGRFAPPGTALANGSSGEEAAAREDSRDPIVFLAETGVMTELPDGLIHPDEKVTRMSYYVIVSRLVDVLGASRAVLDEAFPGGYRGTLTPGGTSGASVASGDWLSGREAVDVLEIVKTRGLGPAPSGQRDE